MKFKCGDIVKINSGFYRDHKAMVVGCEKIGYPFCKKRYVYLLRYEVDSNTFRQERFFEEDQFDLL